MSTPYYAIPSHPLADDEPGLVAATKYLGEYFSPSLSPTMQGPLVVGMIRAADQARRDAAKKMNLPEEAPIRVGDWVYHCNGDGGDGLFRVIDIDLGRALTSNGETHYVDHLIRATVATAQELRNERESRRWRLGLRDNPS